MAEGDACLLDSNILLRISKSDDPQQPVIAEALKTLVGQGVRLCYTSQTLAEFWNASTRPFDKNGFGLSIAETDRLARVIERDFEFLPDSREIHERWRALLVVYNVQGVQVHDARLAAAMEAGLAPGQALTAYGLRLCQHDQAAEAATVLRLRDLDERQAAARRGAECPSAVHYY